MHTDLEKITKIKIFVQEDMNGLCISHDFYHIQRVWKLAKKIQKNENEGNIFIIEAAALLHEYFDKKFFDAHMLEKRTTQLDNFLSGLNIDESTKSSIIFIAQNIGRGKSLDRKNDFPYTIEFMIVEDADRIEAIGAIAIARTFSYGGKHNRAIYDSSILATKQIDSQTYLSTKGKTSMNHFYEKLLLLKNHLYTDTAKKIAEPRHAFMEQFIEQFLKERNGER